LAFRRNDWTPQVARQWRPKPGDVAGNPSVIPRQCCQAICNVVMIGAVKLVRRGIMRAVAPQRPQYRASDEQQSQRGTARKDFSGKPRDFWSLCAQSQGLRAISGWWRWSRYGTDALGSAIVRHDRP